MKTRKSIILAMMLAAGLSSLTFANGLNLNGLGGRAVAMGGAFVALADDFSAVFWNPAGLSNFKTRVLGFYGVDLIPSTSYLMQAPGANGLLTLVDAKTKTKHYLAGLGAYYQPVNDRIVVGIGIYTPSGLGAAWDGNEFIDLQDYELGLAPGTHGSPNLWESRIGKISISPAVSYKINDTFAVGAALNIDYGMFSLKRWAGVAPVTPEFNIDLGQFEAAPTAGASGRPWACSSRRTTCSASGRPSAPRARSRSPARPRFRTSTSSGWFRNPIPRRPSPGPGGSPAAWPSGPRWDLVFTADLQWTQWSKLDEIETSV